MESYKRGRVSLAVKTALLALALTALFAGSASAGSIAIYPTWWNTNDADAVGGLGVNFAWPIGKSAVDIEARLSYYEELTNEPLDDFFSGNSPLATGLKVLPLEVGARFNFARDSAFWHPWLGAGAAYFSLDSDSGNIDDELGFYATFGSTFGDGKGADFYTDLSYRFVQGEVSDFGDLNGDGLDDSFDVDLGGPVVNVGVVWHW